MTYLILVGLALITGRLIFVYYHPFGPCRRCGGRGTNPFSTTRRSGRCKRCGGTKVTQRPGSMAIQRVVRGASDAAKTKKKLLSPGSAVSMTCSGSSRSAEVAAAAQARGVELHARRGRFWGSTGGRFVLIAWTFHVL